MHLLSDIQKKIWLKAFPVFLWLILLSPGTLSATDNSSEINIKLNASAIVSENTVRLGDVAEIKGNDDDLIAKLQSIILSPAPPLGQDTFLSRETVHELLMHRTWAQSIPLSGASRIRISRACTRIAAQKLEQIGREYIEQHMPWRQGEANIVNIRVDDEMVPDDKVKFKVTAQPNEDFLGEVPLLITITGKGRNVKQSWWYGEVVVSRQIIVAARSLRRGETITESDVTTKSVALDKRNGAGAADLASVIGMKVKREIHPGQVIKTDYLHEPPVIKRGEVVMLVAESQMLRVTTQGRAKEDGCQGDSIRVMNLASKREIIGLVGGPALIKVAY